MQGAASEGDFHAGMLLSATLPCPTLFIVRNNGFAISTPAQEQYGRADGIASRGPGYGMDTIRYEQEAIEVARRTQYENSQGGRERRSGRSQRGERSQTAMRRGRTRRARGSHDLSVRRFDPQTNRQIGLSEGAMVCSVGHHSTSDDSFAYRARQEVEDRKRLDNPIARYRLFLEARGWWSDDAEEEMKARLKNDVLTAFKKAEVLKRGPLDDIFKDVWGGQEPWTIVSLNRLFQPLSNSYSWLLGASRQSSERSWLNFYGSMEVTGNRGGTNWRSSKGMARSSLKGRDELLGKTVHECNTTVILTCISPGQHAALCDSVVERSSLPANRGRGKPAELSYCGHGSALLRPTSSTYYFNSDLLDRTKLSSTIMLTRCARLVPSHFTSCAIPVRHVSNSMAYVPSSYFWVFCP